MYNYYNILLLIIFEFAIASTFSSLYCSCFYCEIFVKILGGGGGGIVLGGYPRAPPCMRP